jgi:hypothetical protein
MSANNSNDGRGETPQEVTSVWTDIVLNGGKIDPERVREILLKNQPENGDKLDVVYVDEAHISRITANFDALISELVAEQHRRIVLPPGHKLSVVAGFLLTRGAFKRYVEPVIADMQQEYVDAIAAGDEWRALWIAVRGHLLIVPGWIYALIAGKLLAPLLRRGR